MLKYLKARAGRDTIPLTPLDPTSLKTWLKGQSTAVRTWVKASDFTAAPGTCGLIADDKGRLCHALAGIGGDDETWDWATLPARLPAATTYRVDTRLGTAAAGRAALGWALGTYRFDRYRKSGARFASLVWPDGCDRAAITHSVRATGLVRDLINTPAADMGPAELAAAARRLAGRHQGRCRVITGDALLGAGYPAIHAVGRASSRAPRLIDMTWGKRTAPKVTLVGKGVCFDTGGLDLKSSAGMKLMKKDMGGAATVLGLADMVMAARLPVRLRVLIPAVENSVSGNAMRPLDVVATRRGLTVEIGNTDAEGRVILADALTTASADKPALLIDCATLTGAARVALGPEVPAFFTNDDALANGLDACAAEQSDPLWRLPLWRPYRRHIESRVADLTNAPDLGLGGAITAALFLGEFVDPGIPWVHLDMMAWNSSSRPGRPEGGEAMGMRALAALVTKRFGMHV